MLAARKNPKRRAARLRDPERTRERLLQAASREIYRSGFQSAGLDTILASAGVTKGALYYHFKSKEALGYAVVEEVIAPDVHGKWVRPLRERQGPYRRFDRRCSTYTRSARGCAGWLPAEQSGAGNVSS